MPYDIIIIGAGLSGLAAAVRLSHFGKKVKIFEAHHFAGGLNSYYFRQGEAIDVGLHALTNFVPVSERRAPLNILLRQLRLQRDDLQLCPQSYSIVDFPGTKLRFSNDFELLSAEVSREFPDHIDEFIKFSDYIRASDPYNSRAEFKSSKAVLKDFISSSKLRNMLSMPLMYYGNPLSSDMDFKQFSILFHSIFLEGLARPAIGMKNFIDILLKKIQDAGAEISLNNPITKIHGNCQEITGVSDSKGKTYKAKTYITNAGVLETTKLCENPPEEWQNAKKGEIAFLETVFFMKNQNITAELEACNIFLSNKDKFAFIAPDDKVQLNSQVFCIPGNYQGCENIPAANQLRMTHLANPDIWCNLEKEEYENAKEEVKQEQVKILEKLYPELSKEIFKAEMHTPKTVQRFTGRERGCIYGSPTKFADGNTSIKNLFICGTDQGLLGIAGALISGINCANQRLT